MSQHHYMESTPPPPGFVAMTEIVDILVHELRLDLADFAREGYRRRGRGFVELDFGSVPFQDWIVAHERGEPFGGLEIPMYYIPLTCVGYPLVEENMPYYDPVLALARSYRPARTMVLFAFVPDRTGDITSTWMTVAHLRPPASATDAMIAA